MKPTLRIIGGRHRGRRIFAVPGNRTRPTANRVREAIFNILSGRVRDGIVLDLFAGSGAMSLEALSRGAATAVCVDNSRDAIETIRRNADICRESSALHAIQWPVHTGLACIRHHRPAFDIVFMDPPYRSGLAVAGFQALAQCDCLAPAAMVVVEHGADEAMEIRDQGFEMNDRRQYGKSLVSFFTCVV